MTLSATRSWWVRAASVGVAVLAVVGVIVGGIWYAASRSSQAANRSAAAATQSAKSVTDAEATLEAIKDAVQHIKAEVDQATGPVATAAAAQRLNFLMGCLNNWIAYYTNHAPALLPGCRPDQLTPPSSSTTVPR